MAFLQHGLLPSCQLFTQVGKEKELSLQVPRPYKAPRGWIGKLWAQCCLVVNTYSHHFRGGSRMTSSSLKTPTVA